MQRADVYERRYDESTEHTNANTCPECDGRVTTNTAETVCDDCGLVLADQSVDTGPEWRDFDDGSSQELTGAPRTPARHDRGLSTEVGFQRASADESYSGRKRRRPSRMRHEHARAQHRSTAERNEMHGLTEIRRMCRARGFSNEFRDRACRLFSTAQDRDLLRGRSIEAMAAASVYAACRCDGRPQTIEDVAAVAQVPQVKVQLGYDVINRGLELPAAPVQPAQFLPRFVSALDLPRAVERRARELLGAGQTPDTRGSNPAAVAGGALIVAAAETDERQRFTQVDVATVVDVSVVTLRRYRDEFQASE